VGIERGEGFVLRVRDFAEADLIVTLFLRRWGKRTAIAKGARRLDSRLGGVFDLLNRVEVVFYPRDRLDLVSQGTLLDGYERLKRSLPMVQAALSVARGLDRFLPLHQPEDEAHRLVERFLFLLTEENAVRMRIALTLKLLSLLGHQPHFSTCLRCGRRTGPFRFLPARGGILCSNCAGEEGIPLSAGLSRSLAWLLSHPLERSGVIHLSEEEWRRADELLGAYIEALFRA